MYAHSDGRGISYISGLCIPRKEFAEGVHVCCVNTSAQWDGRGRKNITGEDRLLCGGDMGS